MGLLCKRAVAISLVMLLVFASITTAAGLPRQTVYKHGVSENGELQVYQIARVVKDGKTVSEVTSRPYSPKTLSNMEGFDSKSIEIAGALSPKVMADLAIEQKQPVNIGLEEIVRYDRMVDSIGRISVRRVTRIYEDGKVISKKYHRSWIMPGQDPAGNDVISKALAEKLHTPEVIEVYKDFIKERRTSYETQSTEGILGFNR